MFQTYRKPGGGWLHTFLYVHPGFSGEMIQVDGCIFFQNGLVKNHTTTPRKINMEPKNGGLEDDFPFQLGDC